MVLDVDGSVFEVMFRNMVMVNSIVMLRVICLLVIGGR